jgi:tripartite-type tricarboxylate transporter receptor subunit TctC
MGGIRQARLAEVNVALNSSRMATSTVGDKIMKLPRRKFLHLAAGAAALPATSRFARAQAYPARPVTLIVPFAAGGTTDIVARIVGEYLSRTLGQQFVIENVGGAGGTTGTTRTMRASPDGYTIQVGQMGTHAAAVAFYPNLAYRPDVDFEPIGMIAGLPIVITARKDFPADDLKEFIRYVKANAGKVNAAHAGVGSITHTTCLLLHSLLDVHPTFVPFTGAAPAMNALLAGQVDYICNAIPDAVPHVQAGTAKGYAISTAERSPSLPNVPTTKEAGLPDFDASAWNALFAPKGTPQPVLDQLTAALGKALDDDSVRKRLAELGCDVPGNPKRGQQALAALVKSEIARWTRIIKAASAKAE